MWLEHLDDLVNLDNVFQIIKHNEDFIYFFKSEPIFSDDRTHPLNGVGFCFYSEEVRDAYWDKHIIPLLNK